VVSTLAYYLAFRKEFTTLQAVRDAQQDDASQADGRPVPGWVTAVQLGFMAVAVSFSHYPALFIGSFLFFLAFSQATAHHQSQLDLKPPLLVGFFLAGLVVHGGLQGWWIEPVLKSLGEVPLFLSATVLTAFNDNAAITYLATLVPGFTEPLKYMVVAGAVTGGGLTVIANAPNPAGQSILQRFFIDGVSPLGLLAGAIVPTVVMAACFLWL
jgi:Na+/H+ antiporter NhaD/arsenite permease-like protein